MSALAMSLMAGMAVGDMPKQDVGEAEEWLDLSGEWEGTFYAKHADRFKARLIMHEPKIGGRLILSKKGFEQCIGFTVSKVGAGRLRLSTLLGRKDHPAIFCTWKQEGERLTLCWKVGSWPLSFRVEDSQELLVLHRFKPRK